MFVNKNEKKVWNKIKDMKPNVQGYFVYEFDVEDCIVDDKEGYQRGDLGLTPTKDFDWEDIMSNPIKGAYRKDIDKIAIPDGGNTARNLLFYLKENNIPLKIPVCVFVNIESLEQECYVFSNQNANTKKILACDRWKSELVAKNEYVVAINNILLNNNMCIKNKENNENQKDKYAIANVSIILDEFKINKNDTHSGYYITKGIDFVTGYINVLKASNHLKDNWFRTYLPMLGFYQCFVAGKFGLKEQIILTNYLKNRTKETLCIDAYDYCTKYCATSAPVKKLGSMFKYIIQKEEEKELKKNKIKNKEIDCEIIKKLSEII